MRWDEEEQGFSNQEPQSKGKLEGSPLLKRCTTVNKKSYKYKSKLGLPMDLMGL